MNDKQVAAILKTNEMLLNKLIAVQAECQAIREANTLLLKSLKFPDGHTPAEFMQAIIHKAKTELEQQANEKLAEIMATLK
jgi:hypothetical protein